MKILKPKVAIVSDLHAGIHQNSTNWHDVLFTWAEWFKKECIKNDIKDIIIPGDLLHERNEVNVHTLHALSKVMESLKQFNIIIVIGNHDSYYKERTDVHSLEMLKQWDNITIVDKPTHDTFFGVDISFCPWMGDLKELPTTDIMIGHFEIQGFNVTKEAICEQGINPIKLIDKAPLVISGHFHGRDEKKFKKGTILYVGCAYELYWGDSGQSKGYYILDIPSKTYEFTENTISPKHIKIPVSDVKKFGITDQMKRDIKNNWVKMITDVDVNSDALMIVVEKLRAFKPRDIKVDYTTDSINVNEGLDLNITGVDITKSIHEYVENIDIEHKSSVEKYILELYGKVS